jgi:transposase-like protein
VISLADKQKIIIAAVLEGKTKSQISREVKISRTTVAKYIKDYEQAKSKLAGSDDIKIKEEIVSPPRYDISNRAKVKLTDEIVEKIQLYLKENEERSSRKKRLISWKL